MRGPMEDSAELFRNDSEAPSGEGEAELSEGRGAGPWMSAPALSQTTQLLP